MYYRPRIDHEILEKYSEGLIASSACLGGEIHKKIESGNLEEAEKAVLWYKKYLATISISNCNVIKPTNPGRRHFYLRKTNPSKC